MNKTEKRDKHHYYRGYLQGVYDILNILIKTYGNGVKIILFDTSKCNAIIKSLRKKIQETWEWGYMYYDENKDTFIYIDEEYKDPEFDEEVEE